MPQCVDYPYVWMLGVSVPHLGLAAILTWPWLAGLTLVRLQARAHPLDRIDC
jgi:hypothetical protein